MLDIFERTEKIMTKNAGKEMQKTMGDLKRPVKIIVFTNAGGIEGGREALELARTVKALSPKIGLETYDLVMDRDKAEQYGIGQVPATVVQGMDGRTARFYGVLEDVFVSVLLETIGAVSREKAWFPEEVLRTLKLLEKVVSIRVYVETDCPQCKPMAETALGLAFENDFVLTDIINAADFPDLIKKNNVKVLPLILFGENIRREGHVSEGEFLELVFKAEGLREERVKHCIVCGTSSPDIICDACKIRIQAEAVDHKLRGEKLKRSDNVA